MDIVADIDAPVAIAEDMDPDMDIDEEDVARGMMVLLVV